MQAITRKCKSCETILFRDFDGYLAVKCAECKSKTKEASRKRARLNQRAYSDAMRSVGMTRTKYGWE